MSCPNCGCGDVVSKSEAWDAANEVPAKVQRRLDDLEDLLELSRMMFGQENKPSEYDPMVMVFVKPEHLNIMKAKLGVCW